MKRNAFVSDESGLSHFEPEMLHGDDQTMAFWKAMRVATNRGGCAAVLSQSASIDSLLHLRQVIDDELTARAECELDEAKVF